MGKSYGKADHRYARDLSDQYMAARSEKEKQEIDRRFDTYFDQSDTVRPTSPTNAK